jgi:hypothetical protein
MLDKYRKLQAELLKYAFDAAKVSDFESSRFYIQLSKNLANLENVKPLRQSNKKRKRDN